jgi:LPS-assembly protein
MLMKNRLVQFLIIIFFYLTNFCFSNSFEFNVKNIEVLDKGNKINAYFGKAETFDGNIQISSDKFNYLKNENILKAYGKGEALINKKIKIIFEEAVFDQKNLNINILGNAEIYELNKNFIIKSKNIFYDRNNYTITSEDTTKIEVSDGNIYFVDSFNYNINDKLLKVINLISKDINDSTFKTSIAFINTESEKIFGKDIQMSLKDSNKTNNSKFRLKGNSVIINNNSSEINKGVFTTCKKRDDCPPWQFNAKKIKHDKKKREISYEKAFLKIYNIPIAYFPKFFHPDPSVKRKSGFLIPSINSSSNSRGYLSVPFFYAISDNKDATFNPRIYSNEKILLQSEYRQKNSKSDHIADFSFFEEKNKKTENHFFYEFDKELTSKKFDYTKINFKLQSVSNDIYLKSNKIQSELIKDNNILENSFELDLYSNDFSLNLNSTLYEDLNKKNNDRYEYIIPKISFIKNLSEFKLLSGNFFIKSETLLRHYNTNVEEKSNINDLIFNSSLNVQKFGFLNNHEFLIRNYNSENKNSNYKNKKNIYLSGIYQFNSSLPMIKENKLYQNILKPKLSLKIAPNHTKDDRNSDGKIDTTNVYSLNRATDNKSLEGGLSAAYGFDYKIFNKEKNIEILNLKLANNLRLKENDDLTNSNQIGEKTSNIFSEIEYTPNNFITTKYVSAIKNNFQDIAYENFVSEFSVNNIVTKFDYLNENNTSNKNSYLSNKTTYSINKYNDLSFSTRKNKTKDLTEYYNFMYQYKNDCLAASIQYNKDFYSDRELKPEESILFKLTIIPLGGINTPNLKNR